ncbi:hypothetical protein ABT160_14255 [Streptomyces sp. NPDC001941]|uniref:hypothetical protein n=1 Tax=Streptomyces sp. NPDC001941 TaxID=3154659 RepID=UPI003332D078
MDTALVSTAQKSKPSAPVTDRVLISQLSSRGDGDVPGTARRRTADGEAAPLPASAFQSAL